MAVLAVIGAASIRAASGRHGPQSGRPPGASLTLPKDGLGCLMMPAAEVLNPAARLASAGSETVSDAGKPGGPGPALCEVLATARGEARAMTPQGPETAMFCAI